MTNPFEDAMLSEPTALDLERRAWATQDEQDRQADEALVQRWNDFIATLRESAERMRWADIAGIVTDVFDDPGFVLGPLSIATRDYAASDGWPMTFRALAQALQADETERRELADRR